MASLLRCGLLLSANDLVVGPATLVDGDLSDGLVFVQFDIGWQNSWRVSTAPNNWDAAWVFVKFRAGSTDPVLAGASSAGTTITVPSTALLRVGMPINLVSGTGTLAPATVITAITSATTITVNAPPFVALSGATLRFDRIWEHAHLGNSATHSSPAGTTITVGCADALLAYSSTNPGVGVFIHRSVDGSGSLSAPGCQLQWLHGAQGITIGTALEVCVHAVEMVLVPTGNYYLGGGGTWAFRNGTGGTTPRLITSENLLPYADTFTATLSYGGAGLNLDFSAGFPKGHEGFYCMKYELSQGEFVAYLNKLTRLQQALMVATNVLPGVTSVANRYVMSNSATVVNRSAIRCPATIDRMRCGWRRCRRRSGRWGVGRGQLRERAERAGLPRLVRVAPHVGNGVREGMQRARRARCERRTVRRQHLECDRAYRTNRLEYSNGRRGCSRERILWLNVPRSVPLWCVR
jgi:hypothetical protein